MEILYYLLKHKPLIYNSCFIYKLLSIGWNILDIMLKILNLEQKLYTFHCNFKLQILNYATKHIYNISKSIYSL